MRKKTVYNLVVSNLCINTHTHTHTHTHTQFSYNCIITTVWQAVINKVVSRNPIAAQFVMSILELCFIQISSSTKLNFNYLIINQS